MNDIFRDFLRPRIRSQLLALENRGDVTLNEPRFLRLRESVDRIRAGLISAVNFHNSGMSRNVVFKPIGDACNIRCSYCPTRNVDIGRLAEFAAIERILLNSIQGTAKEVDITIHGGEPLLVGKSRMRQILVSIESLREQLAIAGRTYIQTNGTLLDREWAELFKAHSVGVGVSIDGSQSAHDLHRVDRHGKGTFTSVMKGLSALSQAEIIPGILFVLPDEPYLWPDVLDVIKSGLYSHIDLEIKYAKCGSSYAREYGERLGELFECWLECRLPLSFSPNLFQSILDKIVLDGGSLCWVTGTCDRHVGVNQNGVLTPCCDRLTGNAKYSFGSLHETKIEDLLNSPKAIEFYQNASAMHEDCQQCNFRSVCNGGCVYYRIDGSGSAAGKDPLCSTYKVFFAHVANAIDRYIGEFGPSEQARAVSAVDQVGA